MNTENPVAKGNVEYHNRTDFRALDVFVQAIDRATKEELKQARLTCKEMIGDLRLPVGQKTVWLDLRSLINKQIKRF